MLLLREGVDYSIAKAVAGLRKNNVKIIAFSNCVGRTNVPEIPDVLRRGNRVYAGDMLKRGLPVTQEFGLYDEYCGFDENSVRELTEHVKAQNKTVAILGFSDYASEAIEKADLFITCAPISAGSFGRFDEEIRALEIPGEKGSASCTQSVKANADIILMRPSENKGGLTPLARAMEYCKVAYRNLKNFTLYTVLAHVLRIIVIVFPMLLGNSTADARQLIFFSAVIDFLAMTVFMSDTRRCTDDYGKLRAFFKEENAYSMVRSNIKLSLCTLVGALLTLLLPTFFGMFSFFGSYIYRAEFTFMSLAMINLALLLCVYVKDIKDVNALHRLVRDKWAISALCVCVVFTAVCLVCRPIGAFFGIVRNPVFYFLLSFIPPVAFMLCFVIISTDKKRKM
jgi:magnesium-transporting ATPase (P-type)